MEELKAALAAMETSRVGVRPPPFYPDDPEMWFAQMECQFAIANVTADSTKFQYVVCALEPRFATEIKDVITKPPPTDKYIKLKSELIKRLSASRERKVQQLLRYEELGDRKPSQFLRHLQNLAGPSMPDDFLKTLWSGRLPNILQTVLASQPELSLDKLAELADTVHDIAPAGPQQVATASSPSQPSLVQDMMTQISELSKQVALLSTKVRNHSHTRCNTRDRKSSRSRSRPRQPPPDHPHCFYHYTYGVRARKCVQPCDWRAENARGSRN